MANGNMKSSKNRLSAAAATIALALTSCSASNNEDKLGKFLVASGKYRLYDCEQLARSAAGYISRERELAKAQAKAEAGPGGGVVSVLAYSGEYGLVRGNIDELRREAMEKKCDPMPPGLAPGSAGSGPNRQPAR